MGHVTVLATTLSADNLSGVDPDINAVSSLSGTTATFATDTGDVIAEVLTLGDGLGVTVRTWVVETLGEALVPGPGLGDEMWITGTVARLPIFQIGLNFCGDDDGVYHMEQAGVLSTIYSELDTRLQALEP